MKKSIIIGLALILILSSAALAGETGPVKVVSVHSFAIKNGLDSGSSQRVNSDRNKKLAVQAKAEGKKQPGGSPDLVKQKMKDINRNNREILKLKKDVQKRNQAVQKKLQKSRAKSSLVSTGQLSDIRQCLEVVKEDRQALQKTQDGIPQNWQKAKAFGKKQDYAVVNQNLGDIATLQEQQRTLLKKSIDDLDRLLDVIP